MTTRRSILRRKRAPGAGRPAATGTPRSRPIQVRVAPDEHAVIAAAVAAHNLSHGHDLTTPSDWLRRHGVAAARAELAQEAADDAHQRRVGEALADLEIDA